MRNEKQTEGAEIVYNPPFKKEARKKTAEILQATQEYFISRSGKVYSKTEVLRQIRD